MSKQTIERETGDPACVDVVWLHGPVAVAGRPQEYRRSAGCVAHSWTQEFATSPAHSASTVVLGLLSSVVEPRKFHQPLSHCQCHQL